MSNYNINIEEKINEIEKIIKIFKINNINNLIFLLEKIQKNIENNDTKNMISKLIKELENKCYMDIKELEKLKEDFKKNLQYMNEDIYNIYNSNQKIEKLSKEHHEEEIYKETTSISSTLDKMEKEITELREQINKLEKEVYYDVFLNIYNRKKLIEDFEDIYKNKEIYIGIIDLDNFKKINDTYGHLIGDKILLKFIKIIEKYIDPKKIYRYGGDEFIIFIDKDTNIKELFNKIRNEFERKKFKIILDNQVKYIKISFSCGIYLKNSNENNFAEVLEKADIALYKSKENGKNQVTIYE